MAVPVLSAPPRHLLSWQRPGLCLPLCSPTFRSSPTSHTHACSLPLPTGSRNPANSLRTSPAPEIPKSEPTRNFTGPTSVFVPFTIGNFEVQATSVAPALGPPIALTIRIAINSAGSLALSPTCSFCAPLMVFWTNSIASAFPCSPSLSPARDTAPLSSNGFDVAPLFDFSTTSARRTIVELACNLPRGISPLRMGTSGRSRTSRHYV